MDETRDRAWRFDPVDLEANASIARFVSQSDWFVDETVGAAFRRFARYTGNRHGDFRAAVDVGDPVLVRLVMGSLYNQARAEFGRRRIRYEYERAFDSRSGRQRILAGEEIARGRNATCLDLALWGAALFAQVKLQPLLAFLHLEGGMHVVVAVHLATPQPMRATVLSVAALARAIEAGDALAVEMTSATTRPDGRRSAHGFDAACATAATVIGRAARGEPERGAALRSVAIDIWRAWELGHHPFSAGEVETLRRRLKPPDFAARVHHLAAEFVGRGRWLADIRAWAADPRGAPLFWVVADPGVGKSALAAKACLQLQERVAARHFCAFDDGVLSSPRGLAASLAFQLGESVPGYHAWLIRQDLDQMLGGDAREALRCVLVKGIEEAWPSSGAPRVVVIDALDEAARDETNPLAELLGELASRHALPAGLRFLLTSRPVPSVMRALAAIPPHRLERADPANASDLRAYVARRAAGRLRAGELDLIAARADGLFLYAKAALDAVAGGGDLAALPQGLGNWLRQAVVREFGRDFGFYDHAARPLLEIVAAAPRPIPRACLPRISGLSEPALQAVLDRLSHVIDAARDGVRFRHLSFKELLADSDCAGEFVLDERRGRAALIETSWRIAEAGGPEADVCLEQLPALLMAAGEWYRFAAALLHPEFRLIDRWIDAGRSADGIEHLTRLVQVLEGGRRHRPLEVAFSTQIARLLLQRQACEAARPWLQRVLRETSISTQRRMHAIALHELASLELYEGRHGRARWLFARALLATWIGRPRDHDEAAGNLLGLATLQDGALALRLATLADREAERGGDQRHRVSAQRVIASINKRLGRFERAMEHVDRSLALAEAHGIALERSRSLVERASVLYWSSGRDTRFDEIRAAYETALDAARSVRDGYWILRGKINLGFCALQQRETAAAEAHFGAANAELHGNAYPETHVQVALGRAQVLHQLGDLAAAATAYRELIDRCSALSNWFRATRVTASVGLAAISWHRGDRERARRAFEQARRFARPLAGLERMAEISMELCRVDPSAVPR